MDISVNGNPNAILYGVDDRSIPPLVPTPVRTAIHVPLVFTWASQGDETNAYTVLGDTAFEMYGRDLIELNGEYTSINTPFIELFNRLANPMMVQRIVAEDATVSTRRDFAEVLTTKVPKYDRNADGSVKLDENGEPKVLGEQDGVTITWRTGQITDESGAFGAGNQYAGSQTNASGDRSVIYPMLDQQAPWRGRRGNDRGFRLSCLNAKTSTRVNAKMVDALQARVFEMQYVERPTKDLSPEIVKTNDGQPSVMFAFKPKAYYRPTRLNLDVDRTVVPAWRQMHREGMPPKLGMVEKLHVYRQHLENVMEQCRVAINTANGNEDIADKYMVDIFTGLDVDGNPYNGLVVDNGEHGGIIYSDKNTQYLMGGSDGTMTDEAFDLAVRKEMTNFGKGKIPYLDMARYPCSFLWDAGFTTDTKMALCTFIGRRKDTNVVLSTHVYNEPVNTLQVENSMKLALNGFITAYPESEKYSTPSLRGNIVGHSYLLKDSEYLERVPASYELAKFTAKYAGSQESRFKPEARFSRGELTIITSGYDINLVNKDNSVYESDWDKGMINIRSYDEYRFHIPALYNVYDNDRSVCKGYIYQIVVSDVERVANRVWKEMSGVSDMTPEQIVKEINARIIKATNNKYDNTTVITPDAYFTEQDHSNGNTVTIDIYVGGNVINTVHKYTIVAVRRA